MKKEAMHSSNMRSVKANGQAAHKVVAKKQIHDDDADDMDDTDNLYADDKEDDDYIEPKGPEKSDLKKNILFIDDDDDFEEEF